MNKITKLMIFTMMMICALAITGCGGNDKFSGTWSSVEGKGPLSLVGHTYRLITIEKNSDSSYIVKYDNTYWYELDHQRISGNTWDNSAVYKMIYKWENLTPKKGSATLKGNTLEGPVYLTYVEKDDTLLDGEGRTYKREKSEEDGLKTFKENEQKRLLDIEKKYKGHLIPQLKGKFDSFVFK